LLEFNSYNVTTYLTFIPLPPIHPSKPTYTDDIPKTSTLFRGGKCINRLKNLEVYLLHDHKKILPHVLYVYEK
jgi:hypothetical protein